MDNRAQLLCLVLFVFACPLLGLVYHHPVVVVPGSYCSKLEVRVNSTLVPSCPASITDKWHTLWFNPIFFEPGMLECLETILTMHYDPQRNAFFNAPGIEVEVAAFGSFSSLLPDKEADFKTVREALSAKGYKEGVDMFAAPYEWRRAIIATPEFITSMSATIESIYTSNGNQRVHLICHSSGGSMLLYFLNQQTQNWKDKYIESMISLSGNFAGEVDNYHDIISGLPLISGVSKTIYQTWDFYAWLLPNPQVYGNNRTLIFTDTKNYTAYDAMQLLADLNMKGIAALYPQYSQLTGALNAPNVNTHCFYGTEIPTAAGYVYTTLDKPDIHTIEGDGDGDQDDTTNQSCKKWASMSPNHTFESRGFPGVKHTQLPINPEVVDAIVAIVIS